MPQPYLKRILEDRTPLNRDEARVLMEQIFASEFNDLRLAALLGAIAARGEDPAELAGFVDAMRSAATPLPLNPAEQAALIDTCGTGGDASGTFNISTAAALVAAAAAPTVMVAKHGNRAVTSQSGSADVLEALGIPVTLSPSAAADALRRHRFAFLHAPSLHPAMKAVMPVRRALGVRTVFNILGPLTNPAGAQAQVMGVYSAHLVPIVAEAMRQLNVRHAFVVHGALYASTVAEGQQGRDANAHAQNGSSTPASISALNSAQVAPRGLDELSISGPSQLAEVRNNTVTLHQLTPEQVGLRTAPIEALAGGNAATNAQILRTIFSGELSPRRDVVLLNAAAVLITSGTAAHADLHTAFRAAITLAANAIDSGAVTALISALAAEHRVPSGATRL